MRPIGEEILHRKSLNSLTFNLKTQLLHGNSHQLLTARKNGTP